MPTPPVKLKHDAIVEALFEVRFESNSIAELTVGRLAAASAWAGAEIVRLPLADLPPAAREASPETRFAPIVQLTLPGGGGIVRVGAHVISMHILAPYPGWAEFKPKLEVALNELFEVCPALSIERMGLRYINALSAEHGVLGLENLEFTFVAGGAAIRDFTAAYRLPGTADTVTQVTLSSPSFIQGSLAPEVAAVADVDVFTPLPLGAVDRAFVSDWLEGAHDAEKKAFFALWPADLLASMTEN